MYLFLFFFFNDTATTEIYTLSLHDALPISAARLAGGRRRRRLCRDRGVHLPRGGRRFRLRPRLRRDRKSTRLNSKSRRDLVCRLLLEKKKKIKKYKK